MERFVFDQQVGEFYLNSVKEKVIARIEAGNPIRMCLSGPSGTGKSTLARNIAKTFNLKYVESSAGLTISPEDRERLMARYGWTGSGHKEVIRLSQMKPDFGYAFQTAILSNRIKLIEKESCVVFDRSPLDNLTYFMLQCSSNVPDFMVDEFIVRCRAAMDKVTHLIIIETPDMSTGYTVEDNNSRISNYYYQAMVNQIFLHNLNRYLLQTKSNYKTLTINSWDFKVRTQMLLDFIFNNV